MSHYNVPYINFWPLDVQVYLCYENAEKNLLLGNRNESKFIDGYCPGKPLLYVCTSARTSPY